MVSHDELEPVGRPTRPTLVVGAWVVVLAAVVGTALLGAITARPSETATRSPDPPAATERPALAIAVAPRPAPAIEDAPRPALAVAVAPRPTPVDRGFPRPLHPTPSRPPIGEDGLMGGIVFGTNLPPD